MRRILTGLAVLAVIVAVGWAGNRWVVKPIREWSQKDAHIQQVSKYVKDVEPKITRHAVSVANSMGDVSDYDRGEMSQRLRALEGSRNEVSLRLNLDKDSDGRLQDTAVMNIQRALVRKVEKRTGMYWNSDAGSDRWKQEMAAERKEYEDLFRMHEIVGRLDRHTTRRVMESDSYPYTMERLAADKAEYDELRPQLDALMAKHGLNK